MTDCYRIQQTEFQGNCIIASRPIVIGEQILNEELPFVWQSVSVQGAHFHKYCEECGVVLRSQLFTSLLTFMDSTCAHDKKEMLEAMEKLLPQTLIASTLKARCCDRNCGVMYCSEQCFNLSHSKGHDWVCESLQTLSPTTQQLLQIDTKGHFGLANKLYAKIAAQCLLNVTKDNTIDLSLDALQVADGLLAEYQAADFTRTMHAYRTGNMEIDPEMFQNLIFPAYFGSQLATPLALSKEMFSQSGSVLWGSGVDGDRRSAQFLSSEIFSEQYYSRIIGTFTINCLSVHVPSPLDHILSEAMRIQRTAAATAESTKQPVTAAVRERNDRNDRIIALLRRFYQHQQEQRRQRSNEDSDEDEEVAAEEIAESSEEPQGRFLGMSGSGLFPMFSKSNHSCLCNTSITGSDRVTVSIHATEAIAEGAEITNCYIHHERLNGGGAGVRDTVFSNSAPSSNEQHALNSLMTKKQRYRALRQYMFECSCPLCNSQVVDSDEDSD